MEDKDIRTEHTKEERTHITAQELRTKMLSIKFVMLQREGRGPKSVTACDRGEGFKNNV